MSPPSPLHVAVNLRTLHPDRIGGLEPAFREVAARLIQRGPADVRLTLLTSPWNHDSFGAWGDRVRRVLLPAEGWERTLDTSLADLDVLWCPLLFLEPVRPPIPGVVMVPDLQHETYPQFFTREVLATRLRLYRPAVSLSARVLTLSEFSRRQILATYDLPPDHVTVTTLDVADAFRSPPDPDRRRRTLERHGLRSPYVLFPANSWPHKNHRAAFQALALYRSRYGAPPFLVLTGARVGLDLASMAAQLGVTEYVRDLGFIASAEMPDLYDGASALFFPSLYEGFGIPVLEAFHRGTPVVASSTTSLPEVAGDAALLADPEEPEALAAALHRVMQGGDDVRAMIDRGRARAGLFSYDKAAEKTWQALRAAAAAAPCVSVVRGARPKVFVVTPSFNQGRFIRQTIESVLGQDYPRLEYFVADGGSRDETVSILESYGDRLRWRSGPDGGQAAAIAQAWRDADADIVAWLNSDDTYLPGALSRAVDFFGERPECSMVYGNAWYTDLAGAPTSPYPTKRWDPAALAGECFICQPTVFIRREVFKVIDYPDPDLRYSMDYDLWIRLSRLFEVGQLDADLATSRMYAENKTLGERAGVFREIMRVSRTHYGYVHPSWVMGYSAYRAAAIPGVMEYLPTPLRRWVLGALTRRFERQFDVPLHADGWASRRSVLSVTPGRGGRVVVRCDSPFWPFRRALEVRVLHREQILHAATIRRRGHFDLEFQVPSANGAVHLVLESNRAFSPEAHRISPDRRELSFRVLEVIADR